MKKLFLLILLFITACKATSEGLSILQKSGCELPCWHGITPGVTTEEEVLQIIKTSNDINQRSIQNDNQPRNIFDNHIFFAMRQNWNLNPSSKIRSDVYIVDNKVVDLIICGEINTTINDVVGEIGEPENIISGNNLTGSRTVILLSPKYGVSYTYDTANLSDQLKYELSPDIEVVCINLFDPIQYAKLMDVGFFSSGHYNAEETLKVMYPWNGYGNLDEKYPPRQP